jgi:hypothetical protein
MSGKTVPRMPPNEFAQSPEAKVQLSQLGREQLGRLIAIVDHARQRGDALSDLPMLTPRNKWPRYTDEQNEVLDGLGELRASADILVTLLREERKRRPRRAN